MLVEILEIALADGHVFESDIPRLDKAVGYIRVYAVGHGIGHSGITGPMPTLASVYISIYRIGIRKQTVPSVNRNIQRLPAHNEAVRIRRCAEAGQEIIGILIYAAGQGCDIAGE